MYSVSSESSELDFSVGLSNGFFWWVVSFVVMKFENGFRVEVCSNDPGFAGAWFEGVIVSHDGLAYKVKYDKFVTDEGQPLVEGMDYSQIRPAPPDKNIKNWSAGDAVEAYDSDCWWRGVVSRVLPGKHYCICFPDSSTEKSYHYSKLRSRQEWQKGKWSIPLQTSYQSPQSCSGHTDGLHLLARASFYQYAKAFTSGGYWVKTNWKSLCIFAVKARVQNIARGKHSIVACSKETSLPSFPEEIHSDAQSQNQCCKVERNVNSKPVMNLPQRNLLKTSSNISEGCNKQRELGAEARGSQSGSRELSKPSNVKQAMGDSGRCKSLISENALEEILPPIQGTNPLLPDHRASKRGQRRDIIDEGFPDEESYKDKRFRCSELAEAIEQIKIEVPKKFGNAVEPHAQGILFSDSGMDIDGKECSVSTTGSCTALALASRDKDANVEVTIGKNDYVIKYSSTYGKNQKNNEIDSAEERKLTTHKLELHAYRSVLQAFHAHGSLSWEREVLLTNLRLELHITCDEHTFELEQLASQL
eukprot:Gb_40212 [translate_table: standard]